MNILLNVIKIGNHWYPNLKHDTPDEITLNYKTEKLLSLLDKHNTGNLQFLIYEVHTWTNSNTVQFNEEDMWRWLNTTDIFDLRLYIKDNEYIVSSCLIDLLEDQFNMDFYDTLYSIELCNS